MAGWAPACPRRPGARTAQTAPAVVAVRPIRGHRQIPGWQATRLNARYHPGLRLAELVLRATSVEHESGIVAVNGFLLRLIPDHESLP